MPSPRRRESYGRIAYIVVDREDAKDEAQAGSVEARDPIAIVDDILQRSNVRRGNAPHAVKAFSIGQKDQQTTFQLAASNTATSIPTLPPISSSVLITMTTGIIRPTAGALADTNPAATAPVAFTPDISHHGHGDGISQATEHFLIAAGSIGTTIIVVMIFLSFYTIHKRALTIKELFRRRENRAPSQYPMDNKRAYDETYVYSRSSPAVSPVPVAIKSRSSSLSTQTLLKPLGRSDSFGLQELERNNSARLLKRDFVTEEIQRSNSHRRDNSAAASSIVLPVQDARRESVSTHNTRSTEEGEEHEMQTIEPPSHPVAPPVPPTFRQFLSNRPTISQRPLVGGQMASRFSWTNSQAPQTPHEPSRDTVAHVERDSFMTYRSSVPRFRTVDSWVNQQSNRIEAQRLKQQFRMTQSTMYSIDDREDLEFDNDQVPEIPVLPESLKESSGLVGTEIKNTRCESLKSTLTAPIFKAHPGTEVRFSTHSTVPSELLDMDRRNSVL